MLFEKNISRDENKEIDSVLKTENIDGIKKFFTKNYGTSENGMNEKNISSWNLRNKLLTILYVIEPIAPVETASVENNNSQTNNPE